MAQCGPGRRNRSMPHTFCNPNNAAAESVSIVLQTASSKWVFARLPSFEKPTWTWNAVLGALANRAALFESQKVCGIGRFRLPPHMPDTFVGGW